MSVLQPNTTGAADVALGRFLMERPFPFDAAGAAGAIARAADIALVIDGGGIIVDVAVSAPAFVRLGVSRWIGKPFADVVTVESRAKLPSLLTGALNGVRRWHQLNHRDGGEIDLPVEYAAVAVGEDEARILAGRELSAVAALQQRLLAAQVEAEREYARLRAAEQRYRVLFRVASEAVVIADAASERVVEANPAAADLFDAKSSRLPGLALATLFDPADSRGLAALTAAARGGGAEQAVLRSASGRPLRVAVSGFLQSRSAFLLLRAAPGEGEAAAPAHGIDAAAMLERMPEGFVACDGAGAVLFANPAFAEMTQCPGVEQLRGVPLGMWLGRTGVDADLLLATLRQHGVVRRFATVLRGNLGTDEEVEITGVAVSPDSDKARFGLTVRRIQPRPPATSGTLTRSVEQMTELVGRVPLRELVRETTDLIERLCIDAALRLADNNRVTAAEMLGLSRQSLYVKMRRFGQLRPGEDETLS